ncbi:MAG: S8 family serine peptidase [Clostridiales bacterium]|nr:S8 family serine peptidase [Clostridiales bacterium]
MKTGRRWAAAVLAAGMVVGAPTGTFAAEKDFMTHVYGPGVANLSVKDTYSQYQWGLKNDAELAYQEIVNRFQESHPSLAWRIDLGNYLGIGSPVEGPDAYRVKTITARRGADINVLPAWELYDASTAERRDVIVAVIDTGIDFSHPELAGAAWVNEDEIPGDGIDNDGNGYVDDVNGWNFFNDTNQIYVGAEDTHGTHAAGTIAAERGGFGIAGITDNSHVKIMSLKVLGTEAGRGEESAVIAAIQYAEANGASICNLSFGTKMYYPTLEQVMRDSKMLFVVSAGNGDSNGIGINIDEHPDYPSSYNLDNIISVANLMFDGNLHESSDYGVNTVDIAAPGTYIVSTTAENGYGYMTGTSMAAPMVTGVAALLYSFRTDISLSDVKPILLATARKSAGLTDKVACGGFPNAYAALTYGLEMTESANAE